MENRSLQFPGFLPAITVTLASVPSVLDGATASGVLWQAAPGRFLLDVPGVARYLVEDGRAVTIESAPGADSVMVTRFLRMGPLSALLNQRGIYTFHAAAVANEQGAILLAGESGSGKSTLLTELLSRGWWMLADELAAVLVDQQGCLTVPPLYPEIALWPDALKMLGKDPGPLPRYDANRRELSLPDQFSSDSHPLRAVYWMNVQGIKEVELVELSGVARFRAVRLLSYNSHITEALFEPAAFMRSMTAITRSTPVRCLRRPRGSWCLRELADMLTK